MSTNQKTILIVEDKEDDQFFIQKAFRDNGVTASIHIVESSEEAICYLMGEGKYSDREKFAFPNFIMMCLKMRQGDSFLVLEHLKANPEWAIIPTVVFSGSTDPDDILKSYVLGASSYHIKPPGYQELRTQLKILYEYWMTCEIPETDNTGRRIKTEGRGRLGHRFSLPSGGKQTRVRCLKPGAE